MTEASPRSTEQEDRLVILKLGDKYSIYDTLTETYVGSPQRSARWLRVKLDEARKNYRPLIVRWVFGFPTAQSKELGIDG